MPRPKRLIVAFLCAAIAALASAARSDSADAVPDVLLSRQLLEAEGLHVGDVVSLSTESSGANARRFRIAGQYEPTPDPMRLGATRYEARLHLPDLIALEAQPSNPLDAETVDAINVAVAPSTDAIVIKGAD